ncbi:iron-containing alcohol dehydrogenase [Vibrio lentus]|nr:iron-containing alcohol dehydrogenase [Vibrio lentus]
MSLRSPDMLADVAIVDPTATLQRQLVFIRTWSNGCLAHLMEAYVCGEPNSLTDMICEEGLRKLVVRG